MATSATPQLNRALRRGALPTRTLPPSNHVMGATPTAPVGDDDPMAELAKTLRPPAGADLATQLSSMVDDGPADAPHAAAAPAIPGAAALPLAPAQQAAGPTGLEQPEGPIPRAPLRGMSRAARYGAPVADPLEVGAPAPHGKSPSAPEPAAAGSSTGGSAQPGAASGRWNQYMDAKQAPEAVSARQAMAAAKVVTPLVAAVSFHPGSSSTPKAMSASLASMLVAVHRASTRVAERWSELYGKDVPAWTVSHLMQVMADVVAQRWEQDGSVDVDELAELVVGVLTNQDGDVVRMVVDAADQAYMEATTPETAANRVAVSTSGAAWDLYNWVTHRELAIPGELPNRFYCYEVEPAQMVEVLLKQCVSFARSVPLNVDHADTRVSHMQASIRRMANLMGAEYVAQTRSIMNWINDPAISNEEFARRKFSASDEFEVRVLPHIFEWARRNFLRVEQGAYNAIENLNEKSNRDSAGGAARPSHV
ncbi:hypothetical protein [Ramlibacter sp. AN1133]|uniref:hypothetical protein n=1 Tax=Ramlibacter sp. AN1133 TaxID=3133429 RepID=UPI0030BBBBB5